MIITLNSFLGKSPIYLHFTSFFFCGFILFLCLEHVPLLPHFTQLDGFICMYLVGWLWFSILDKCPFVGDVPCITAVHSPLVTRTICYKGALYVGCMVPSCGRLTTVGSLVGLDNRQSSLLPAPALCEAVGHWLSGLGHEAAGCRSEGVMGLVLIHWWAELRPRRSQG